MLRAPAIMTLYWVGRLDGVTMNTREPFDAADAGALSEGGPPTEAASPREQSINFGHKHA
jgi:hypothetical protein